MLYKILQIKDQSIYSYKFLKYIIGLSNLRRILKPCSKINLLSNLLSTFNSKNIGNIRTMIWLITL